MAKSEYEKYAVRKPLYEAFGGTKNRQSPTMTFMSNKQVPGANTYIEIGWIYGIPDPNPSLFEMVHDYDEVVLHWGGNPEVPQDLGGEIEFYVGGQPITFNTTTAFFIPKGTPHGPITWKEFRFPHVQMAMMLGAGDATAAWDKSGVSQPKKTLPVKTKKFDYEQYAVRSPMRESGPEGREGRQSPTMTYMSSLQVNAANLYIEFGWIWDVVKAGVGEMQHQKYDEIVLHLGGDPQNPEDLGADMDFYLGGERLSFDTGYALYIPRGTKHGPLVWHKVRKPHIEMAIMLGCGTWAEGWGDSFITRTVEEKKE